MPMPKTHALAAALLLSTLALGVAANAAGNDQINSLKVELTKVSEVRAVALVAAQPRISSELIDNLNASIHLRAVLTDLFLLSEAARLSRER